MSEPLPSSQQLAGNYMTLRKAIGWIGVSLPFAVYLGNWIIFSRHRMACLVPMSDKLPYSLSGYYYSHMRDVFVGGLWAVGVFLLFYNGHDGWERHVTNCAGVFALGVAMFPTSPPTSRFLQTNDCGPVTAIVSQPAPHGSVIGVVHIVCLIGLLSMLAVMALLFTRKPSAGQLASMTEEDRHVELDVKLKRRRNMCYLGCFAAIAAAGALAIVQVVWFSAAFRDDAPWLLYAETLAIVAFGVAWFVKGRALFGLATALRTVGKALGTGRRGRVPPVQSAPMQPPALPPPPGIRLGGPAAGAPAGQPVAPRRR